MTSTGLSSPLLAPCLPRVVLASVASWSALRSVRLRALLEDPDAFESSYDGLSSLPDRYWVELLGSSTWWLVVDGDDVVGCAGLVAAGDGPLLEALWLAPEVRGLGLVSELVSEAAEAARAGGASSLSVDVGSDDVRALRSAFGVGFVLDGYPLARPGGRPGMLQRLVLPL